MLSFLTMFICCALIVATDALKGDDCVVLILDEGYTSLIKEVKMVCVKFISFAIFVVAKENGYKFVSEYMRIILKRL